LRQTNGHFVYSLDDPYIHLAVAKNLARHGVWGVAPMSSPPPQLQSSGLPYSPSRTASALRVNGLLSY
jgi:hypothetical protein